MSLYNYPKYYDVAFGYRDVELECDFIEKKIGLFATTGNQRMLDVACGTGSHLVTLGRRGYEVDGFDLSQRMVEYAQEKADGAGLTTRIWVDRMDAFKVDRTYGVAFNLLTGFNYLLTNREAADHFSILAGAVEPGGIYVVELNHPRDFITNRPSTTNAWAESSGGVEVEVDWDHLRTPVDVITHQTGSNPKILIRDAGQVMSIEMTDRYRIYLYQEMRMLIEASGAFELVDACGSFKLDNPLDDSRDSWRMILVMRRK